MAGPPIGTQEPRSQSPKAPCRLGLAEWEAHVVLVERWKEYRIRSVDFPHFFPCADRLNCCCKNSRFSPLGRWLAFQREPLSFVAQGLLRF
jgi:hypothetical protein